MWRFESTHEQKETEYLDSVIERIEIDAHLHGHAQAILHGIAAQEPLVAQSFLAPQDVRYHAEGPLMRDHLTLMLMALTAVVEGKLHLIDIEEFRRLKGYEGEIQELEDTLKENVAFFEVFTLMHDVCKLVSLSFTSSKERNLSVETYRDRYAVFAKQHAEKSPREIQAQFYLAHKIDVHYHNHARHIHSRVYQELLERLCQSHRLSDRDHEMLDDLVSHHMEFGTDFDVVRPKRIHRYIHLATKRGYDADDFIDLMQGCLFLDGVCGSKRLGPRGYFHDSLSLINCLKSEMEYAPWRRRQKEKERVETEGRARNRLLKEAGLDGVALMDVLHMEPGRSFGLALRRIHAGIFGKSEMPRFSSTIDQEIERRVEQFYQKSFKKGE